MRFAYVRDDGKRVVYTTRVDRTLRRPGLVVASDYYRDADGFGVQRPDVVEPALAMPGWTLLTLLVQETPDPTSKREYHAHRDAVAAAYADPYRWVHWPPHGPQVVVPREAFRTRGGDVCPVPSSPRKPDPGAPVRSPQEGRAAEPPQEPPPTLF